MKTKKITLGIIIVIMSLIFTGCGQKTSPSTTGSTAEPIVLGVASHFASSEGEGALKATELAVEEINAAGGVEVGGTKRLLKLETIDTREAIPSMPITDALAATEKLIIEKKPVAMVNGAFRSEVLLADMDLMTKYKIPLITPMAMTQEFEKKMRSNPAKYKYIFRTGLNVQSLVVMLSNTVKHIGNEFGLKKVYFINEDVLWAKGANGALAKWCQANGWEVIGSDAYPTGATDFSTSLNKAKAGGANLIVPMFDMPQTISLIRQANSMKVPALIAGYISPASNANAWKTFNGEIEGLIDYSFEFGAMSSPKVPKSIAFKENYAKKHGQEAINKMAAHGPGPAYDSVYIIADAIKRAGSLDGDALVTALEQTNIDGVIGKIRFNKDHQVVYGDNPQETAIAMAFQWKSPGVRVLVYPESIAEGKIELPATMKK